ncbi:uncharacterized protein LOC130813053 [Amaranthus tricolor]|uniref:uncharacterized protein LOC130813053 n=1 Tax=Amaranthus tricolor TaxID=29722 RepID=UPI002583FA7D|nr:uncharacterized protein LOC130813053 [Amaranthus tricolor]
MTEYYFQSTNSSTKMIKNKNKFFDFTFIFSFMFSHPIYFSYLIFFSPCLFKLVSFLSPLFFTTFLLFLALLTTLIPLNSIINSKEGVLISAYNTLLENSHPKLGEDGRSENVEEFEVFKVVFEIPIIEVREENPMGNGKFGENLIEFEKFVENPIDNGEFGVNPIEVEKFEENPIENGEFGENPIKVMKYEVNPIEVEKFEENPIENGEFGGNPIEVMKFEEYPIDFFEEKCFQEGKTTGDKCESLTMEEKKVDTKPKKVKKEEMVIKQESIIKRWESNGIEEVYKTPKSTSLRLDDDKKFTNSFSQIGMGSFGSMRKEKEWRRTLACKLFEERHNGSCNNLNVNGGRSEEGMDLLWESHEIESNKVKSKEGETKKNSKSRDKIEDLMMVNDDEDEYYDDNGKFCCLQALKISAGKMNLSMGMKFSKAFKGIGFLQSHVKKQTKRGYK